MIDLAEKFADAGKLGLDTLTTAFNVAFDSGERLLALHVGTSKSLMQELMTGTNATLEVRNVLELFKLESALGQSIVDSAADSIRGTYEIVSQGQQAILELIEPRISEFNEELRSTLDKAVRTVPAGSDLALAAVTSALAVAKRAMESNAPARQPATDTQETSQPGRKTA